MSEIMPGGRRGAALLFALAALTGGALGALAGGAALARGPDMQAPSAAAPGGGFSYPSFAPAYSRSDMDEGRRMRKRSASAAQASTVGKVCVRLCDGFFFPAVTGAGGDAGCSAQCPDAPVALYSMPTDRIADAVSLTGASYSALPVAHRHETRYDATCTCRRDPSASRTAELLRDPTLRRGDFVMTAEGFKVFEGDAGAAHASDFVALARASHVPRDERAALAAMERSTAGGFSHPRGAVTVDDGAPAGHVRQ